MAVVEKYIEMAEPISSRYLVKNTLIDLSSATIRNVMYDLEEMGFIHQPHTSAGRIPTEKGYRFYVDKIIADSSRCAERYVDLQRQLRDVATDMPAILTRCAALLAQQTMCATVISRPNLAQFRVVHFRMYPIAENRVLITVVLHRGLVKDCIADIDGAGPESKIDEHSDIIGEHIAGNCLGSINIEMLKETYQECGRKIPLELCQVVLDFIDRIEGQLQDEPILSGIDNLFVAAEFENMQMVSQIVASLKKHNEIFNTRADAADNHQPVVLIGGEIPDSSLCNTAIVMATYRINDDVCGTIGIVGPTRMEYTNVIPQVLGFSHALERFFGKESL